MSRFRKLPVEVEAVQWLGDVKEMETFLFGVTHWFGPEVGKSLDKKNWTISIVTLEGIMVCSIGDWIIKGVRGEFYPCRDDIFALTYRSVEDDE